MRLDIGLMHGGGIVLALDDDVRFLKAGLPVAEREGDFLGDVGGLGRLGADAGGEQIVEQQRRAIRHGGFGVDDVRQHFILDVDQRDRRVGDGRGGGGDGGEGVALIEHLAARHAVQRHVAEVGRAFADEGFLAGNVGNVGGRDDGLHARQRQGLRGVDRHDARMGMRTALDFANEHAGHGEVGAELRLPRHLVDAVRADRAGADDLEVGFVCNEIHAATSSRISAAASMMARRILS